MRQAFGDGRHAPAKILLNMLDCDIVNSNFIAIRGTLEPRPKHLLAEVHTKGIVQNEAVPAIGKMALGLIEPLFDSDVIVPGSTPSMRGTLCVIVRMRHRSCPLCATR